MDQITANPLMSSVDRGPIVIEVTHMAHGIKAYAMRLPCPVLLDEDDKCGEPISVNMVQAADGAVLSTKIGRCCFRHPLHPSLEAATSERAHCLLLPMLASEASQSTAGHAVI